jgi:DNA-directed RNA polymerase specialized sigma24 family protein
MAQSQRPPLDSELVRHRQAQGLPLGEIAHRIGVPRSTLYDHL